MAHGVEVMEYAHTFAVELVGRDIRQRGVTGIELTLAPFAQLGVRLCDGGLNCPGAGAQGKRSALNAFPHARASGQHQEKRVFLITGSLTPGGGITTPGILRLFVLLNNQRRHDTSGNRWAVDAGRSQGN